MMTSNAHAEEKPRIAVLEPKISASISKHAAKYIRLDMLWGELERSLQNGRKFAVVTRDSSKMKALMNEQAFSKSEASRGNAATPGLMDATNFLVMPTVKDFSYFRTSTAIPNIDSKYRNKDSGRINLEVQIIDTTSGEIKATFSMTESFASKSTIVNKRGGTPSPIYYEKMVKKLAAKTADQLVDTVFPMKIINVQKRTVFINRGQDGGLKKGDTLALFSPGVALIDPDTKENLGSAERKVGTIRVTRVNPKFTTAKITKLDDGETVELGYIIRRP